MDALQEAVRAGEKAKELDVDSSWADLAQAYAAIAQAEAMQLVAKRLEQWMSVQGVGMEMIEAAERGLRYQKENEWLRRRITELENGPLTDDEAQTLADYGDELAQLLP